MAGFCFSGPQSRYHLLPEIEDGTLCRQVSPLPGPVSRFHLLPELHPPGFMAGFDMIDSDKEEFKTIKTMPVLNSSRQPYTNIKGYISDRDRYFGSSISYALFAAEAAAELANTAWYKGKYGTLKSRIEFNGKNEGAKQQIFYRWVRKAYKHRYGEKVDVPEIIRKGMSEQLAKKIDEVRASEKVKKIHDENFSAGGFNARPQKYKGQYLLGTLSEHATGMAVDIDDSRNAQLTLEEWKYIEDLVGKHITRSGGWDSEEAATNLWKDVKEINDLFVQKIKDETKKILEFQAKKVYGDSQSTLRRLAVETEVGTEKNTTISKTPIEQILGQYFLTLGKWAADGFFHLPLELVLELHAHGFNWGASFGTNVDLHHFELDK